MFKVFKVGNGDGDQMDEMMRELAVSTTDVSREARYMRVVVSESCPIPSLMTPRGIPFDFAAEAQL